MAASSTNNNQTAATRSSGDAGRRRSSGTMFASLQQMKRDPANTKAEARRQSVNEQTKAPLGTIASAWNNFTRGTAQK